MRKRFENNSCPFCSVDPKVNEILFENENWMVWENPFPRETLDVQLVIVFREHVRFLGEIPPESWQGFCKVIQWIEGIEGHAVMSTGGMFFARFGDMRYNAGTVPHIHFNYWIPNGAGEERIPLIKSAADRMRNKTKAHEFAKRYESGEVPS